MKRISPQLFFLICCLFTAANAQKPYSIAEIQGNSNASPHIGESVRISGVVTSIVKKGFYLQTPDGKTDADPATSQGIFVFGENSVASVAIGDLIQVDGDVTEFRPSRDKYFQSITEITRPTVKLISKGSPIPSAITLSEKDLDPKGRLDKLERFEGMRVRLDAIVVGPTGGFTDEKTGRTASNGVFFVTLTGAPRPFREPGIAVADIIADRLPTSTPAFDMNPELLRVDTAAQNGSAPLDVPAGATIKDLVGVVDFSRGFYTLIANNIDPTAVGNVKGYVPVSPAGESEVSVGSFNIENFFDDEINSPTVEKEATVPAENFKTRLNKVSLAIRKVLSMPDVLGVAEVENLTVLQKIAARINADAVAAKQTDPKYVAYLENGNDVRGINVGFLVRSAKVRVVETKQLAKNEKLNYPNAPDEKLFDRTPLMLRAEIADPKGGQPLTFAVIMNHLKSYRGIDDAKNGAKIRAKRRMEGEWLANFIQEREKADPLEKIIVCGDFNAFQFNDGYNDIVGTLKGKPEPNVLDPTSVVFNTGLVDLVDYIDQKNRYSYSYDGSAQVLDHMLVNRPLRALVVKFGYARLDADFPLIYANDPDRPERVSDHDAPIVFLTLDQQPKK